MTPYLVTAGCLVVFSFNLFVLARNWKADFGKITRGELFVTGIFAAILPMGFLLALIGLAHKHWGNAWSRFWNKEVF